MTAVSSYSVQQIKFEFLSYIKEFGGKGSDWIIGLTDVGPDAADGPGAIGLSGDTVWISKPALSARAARIVCDHMAMRHRVGVAPPQAARDGGNWIYMYRKNVKDGDQQP